MEFKELQKLVKFCRKNGVFKYKTDQFEIELTKEAITPSKRRLKTEEIPETEEFPDWDSLTPEQKALWSSTPDTPDI